MAFTDKDGKKSVSKRMDVENLPSLKLISSMAPTMYIDIHIIPYCSYTQEVEHHQQAKSKRLKNAQWTMH